MLVELVKKSSGSAGLNGKGGPSGSGSGAVVEGGKGRAVVMSVVKDELVQLVDSGVGVEFTVSRRSLSSLLGCRRTKHVVVCD